MRMLSVVIPAYNEEGNIENTVRSFYRELTAEHIDHEILVIDDNSQDETLTVLKKMKEDIPPKSYDCNHKV